MSHSVKFNNKPAPEKKNSKPSKPIAQDESQFILPIPLPINQDEFKKVMLDFTVDCLLQRPKDVIAYAADYFTNLEQERQLQKSLEEQVVEVEDVTTDDYPRQEELVEDNEADGAIEMPWLIG